MSSTVRLVCLPHAGGGADSYRPWASALPEGGELIAAELPGHGRRLPERPLERVEDVIADLLPRLGDPAAPLVVFGHSMGGLLAYELCDALDRAGTPPQALVVSAMGPPDLLDSGWNHALAEDPEALMDHVAGLGSTPSPVLADPGMRALVLRPLQADFRLLGRARRTEVREVPVPLYALAGDRDPVHPPHEVAGWQRHARLWKGLRVLPGDHFFPWASDSVPRLLGGLVRSLAAGRTPVAAPAHDPYETS
ncbi:thioesterase II family protein [Streptomyces sp. NBC_00151]|jgi:surfactin synthase thioesterase subunit|uniref:thioesterase II family protein n=1 Tax=Streptomyces sp. NBC_00151 TaxID=2975669 RepID=UPI002DDC6366|nr:alpha/beta fold hydrolase [Streptomyces sp. NBC_00151]WRZ36848.1 alpha/beta fold hydrolase [Streptomyces sp. NBC_00151]WRZ44730.1 alpha/beta fold hydrolase [Streptomyces sp. NBC_00151]